MKYQENLTLIGLAFLSIGSFAAVTGMTSLGGFFMALGAPFLLPAYVRMLITRRQPRAGQRRLYQPA